jgi:hypothetical protein
MHARTWAPFGRASASCCRLTYITRAASILQRSNGPVPLRATSMHTPKAHSSHLTALMFFIRGLLPSPFHALMDRLRELDVLISPLITQCMSYSVTHTILLIVSAITEKEQS